jgi:hypothetical protein
MLMPDFLETRVKEDQDLSADDVTAKLSIIELFRALGTDNTMDKDAWIAVREVIRLLCARYAKHPDFNPAWASEWLAVPQRVAFGIDQTAVTR